MSHNLFENFASRMQQRGDADFITTREVDATPMPTHSPKARAWPAP